MTFAQTLAALPSRQRELFRALQEHGDWARPLDLGGGDGSHHSKTLRTLVAKGLVDAERRAVGVTGGSWLYRARESLAPTTADTLKSRLPRPEPISRGELLDAFDLRRIA